MRRAGGARTSPGSGRPEVHQLLSVASERKKINRAGFCAKWGERAAREPTVNSCYTEGATCAAGAEGCAKLISENLNSAILHYAD